MIYKRLPAGFCLKKKFVCYGEPVEAVESVWVSVGLMFEAEVNI